METDFLELIENGDEKDIIILMLFKIIRTRMKNIISSETGERDFTVAELKQIDTMSLNVSRRLVAEGPITGEGDVERICKSLFHWSGTIS